MIAQPLRRQRRTEPYPSPVCKAVAVLDRCGNNWRNGKGGCGPLLHKEYAPTLPTMFLPFIIHSNPKPAGS